MTLQFSVYLKQLPTVRTVMWSVVAVYMTFMLPQVAGVVETFVTQWTLVWFVVSSVDSQQMPLQIITCKELMLTSVTCEPSTFIV